MSSQVPSSTDTPLETLTAWENEGGNLDDLALPAQWGIERILSETFTVGGYRYSKLEDAIAQARRDAGDRP